MDQFCQALLHSFSPSPEVRLPAESFLQSLQQQQPNELLLNLFQVVESSTIPEEIRQSGTILFKNLVHKHWYLPTDSNVGQSEDIFSDETKTTIRGNLLRVMVESPRPIELQLGMVFYDLVKVDYPDRWGTLINDVLALLGSQDTKKIRGALYALQVITKRYEYISSLTSTTIRPQLYSIVDNTFPTLLKLFQYLISLQNTSELLPYEMELSLLKIFWNSVQLSMAPYLTYGDNFQQWLNLFTHLLTRPIPPALLPSDPAQVPESLPWKVKAVVARLFERFMQRYSTPRQQDNPTNQSFSLLFMSSHACPLLATILTYLNQSITSAPIPKVTVRLLSFLNSCLYFSPTWMLIKPNLPHFLDGILFPLLLFTPADAKLFEEDPQDFLRVDFDLSVEFINPRSAVLGFMADTAKLRGEEYLDFFMGFFVNLLNKYLNTPPQQRNPGEKYTSLQVLGHFSYILLNSEKYSPQLEDLLTIHLLPELASPVGFLKARAIWVFGRFHFMKWNSEGNFLQGFQLVLNSLKDTCIPVNIFAALTIQQYLKNKTVLPLMKPIVPQIIESLLNLMNQVDSDDLVGALKSLIVKFGEEIQELIPGILGRIVEQYQKLVARGEELFDEDDQAGYHAALEYLQAIITILDNVRTVPSLFPKLEALVLPLLLTLPQAHVDLLQDYVQIVSYLTESTISESMWKVFDGLTVIYFSWGRDFLQDFLAPFGHFITRGTDRFLAAQPGVESFKDTYLGRVCAIYQREMEDVNGGESTVAVACSLMELVLLACRGRVDPIVPTALDLAVRRLQIVELGYVKVALLEIIAHAIYYNPIIALKFLESYPNTSEVFSTWFALLSKSFKRRHSIKVAVLGLSAIFHVPYTQWPLSLQAHAKDLVTALIDLCTKYSQLTKPSDDEGKMKKVQDDDDKEDQAGSDEDSVDEDLGLTKEEYKALKDQLVDYKKKVYRDEEDVAPDLLNGAIMSRLAEFYDDEDSSTEEEEEDEVGSLVSNVDELVFFLESFRTFGTKEPLPYQQILSSFTPNEQTQLQKLAEQGNQRKNQL